jgi:U3 small nucleolar RNA-associated protein 15
LGFARGGQVKEKGAGSAKSRYFMRGETSIPEHDDFVVTDNTGKKQKLKTHDKHLKKFEYPLALDAALVTQRAPVVVSVVEELVQRGGLRIALSGRDHHTLEPILSFAVRQIDNPQYATVVIDLANFILDMYTSVLGQSITVDELFVKLKDKVRLYTIAQSTTSYHRPFPSL